MGVRMGWGNVRVDDVVVGRLIVSWEVRRCGGTV
jgi:hypothetical protein